MRYQPLTGGGLVVQDLPQHLRRGVHFGALMSNFGWLLRTRPDSLPVETQEKLHDHTTLVPRFAYFLSHSWNSPGYEKYAALVLYVMAPWAMSVGTACVLATILWQRWSPLPCYTDADVASGMNLCHSPWEFVVGNLVAWAVLLLGPHLVRDKPAFFDAVCIPQAPMDAKLEGIRHLPSFVAACDDFIVAWDPLYFTRGWCVYELAMFKGLFPHRRIIVLPIKMYRVMFACQLCGVINVVSFFSLLPICGNSSLPGILCSLISYAIAAHAGEQLHMERRECERQLTSFDFRSTIVQMESDRAEIEKSIDTLWKGGVEELNRMVQTDIRAEVLGRFTGCRAMLHYSLMLIAVYPILPFCACFITAFGRYPAPVQVSTTIAVVTMPLLVTPCAIALAMTLGARCCTTEAYVGTVPWRLRHFAIGLLFSVASWVINMVVLAVPFMIAAGKFPGLAPWQRWYGTVFSIVTAVLFASIAGFMFCPKRPGPALLMGPGASERPSGGLCRGAKRVRQIEDL